MKSKNSVKINRDLVSAGLPKKEAVLLSKAAGLSGAIAKAFIVTNKLDKFEITQQVQVKLFEISYKEEETEAKRLCTKADVVAKYGNCNWLVLNSAIK